MKVDDPKNYYSARAGEYEQIYYRDNPARRAEIDRAANRLAQLAEGRQVLELACGSGYWTKVMSRTAQSIMAVDFSTPMLAEARKKDYGMEVSFVAADMFALPLGESKFDLVVLGFWLSHQPRQAYRQLFEMLGGRLKPDGLIWMIDNNRAAQLPGNLNCHTDEEGNEYQQRRLDDGTTFVIVKNYFEQEPLESLLEGSFAVKNMTFEKYYWTVVLGLK